MPCGNLLRRLTRRSFVNSHKQKSQDDRHRNHCSHIHETSSSEREGSSISLQSPTSQGSSSTTKEKSNRRKRRDDSEEIYHDRKNRPKQGRSYEEILAKVEVERLPKPDQSTTDKDDYSVIRLPNGVISTVVSSRRTVMIDPLRELHDSKQHQRDVSSMKIERELKVVRKEITSEPSNSEKETSFIAYNKDDLGQSIDPSPTQTLAACALTVEVGSFQDPTHIPGLCHLLEHVLSMGSDKFKGEDEFEAFLGANGGSYGAETDTEYTTFYFECQGKSLYAAMEMFSRFFVAPLVRWDSVRKERFAVASEFEQQSKTDSARRMRIICMSANLNNPAQKFTWGNLETLKDNIGEEQLLHALNQFRATHFTGDRVKVAVQADFSVETLEYWVKELFSNIPKRVSSPEVTKPLSTPFDFSKFCRFYKVQSVADICDVDINWVLKPVCSKYRCKPLDYLAYVIGAEGDGSLISFLRRQQLALYVTSEVEEGGLVSNSLYTIFTISIALTEKGRQNMTNVIKTVFGYLKMLRTKKSSQRIWSELQEIAEIGFKYNIIREPAENVRQITQCMRLFPPADYLTGWTRFFEFNSEEIESYLSDMVPANANILLHTKHSEGTLDREEYWFKTKYKVEDIPESWIQQWDAAEPESSFHLPSSNPYIANDFNLVDNNSNSSYPQKILETTSCELWYKGNGHFQEPYTAVNILLSTPQLTTKDIVCQMLFAKMFVYQMIDELYFAQVAHIQQEINSTEYGLEILVHGISQKLPELLKKVALGLVYSKEKGELHQYLINHLKTVLEKNTVNTLSKGASLIEDMRRSFCSTLLSTAGEKYPHVKAITQKEVDAYWKKMLENVYIVAQIQGNITSDKAKTVVEELVTTLKSRGNGLAISLPLARIIPTGETIVSIAAFNPHEENCYMQYYYQYSLGSPEDCAALELFVTTISDRVLTKEQLEYIASITISEIVGVIGVMINVNSQTNRRFLEYAQMRIDTAIKDCIRHFKVMDKTEFEYVKNGYLAMKMNNPRTLKEEASKNWSELKNRGKLGKFQNEIEAIAKLDKEVIIRVVERTMDSTKFPSNVRKLVLQVVGYRPSTEFVDYERSAIIGDEVIYRSAIYQVSKSGRKVATDVVAWRNSLPTYNDRTETKRIQ